MKSKKIYFTGIHKAELLETELRAVRENEARGKKGYSFKKRKEEKP